ncbi:damage-control phosphatase ARMT1 isoform X2 [Megachile rotundata]|uniref:damage-control phosphatase ARMT1 isoform X2 n=1 Tax=Megachile rotundata TaxID=143995 RepID=UPI003FD0C2AF
MSQRSGSIDIQDLQDIWTPFGEQLRGIYKRSFAYITIKDRLPVILTKIIDTLSRNKESIAQKYGENATEEIKQIVGFISKLKNQITTNKTLKPLRLLTNGEDNDAEEWNKYLLKRTEIENGTPVWFNTIWLYCECYMYRTIAQEFLLTCDLSLSAGADVNQTCNPIAVLKSLDENILVDNSESIWNLLTKKETNESTIIDVVLDNAGYELFTDLCLSVFLIAGKFAGKIRFYVKRYPWYISDATTNDFYWTLDYMKNSSNKNLQQLSNLAYDYLKNKLWTIEEESFWTGPYDFADMKEHDPVLYAKLSEAKIAIFKGDLNYRKLVGEINWEYTTEFTEALRGFQPTTILSFRTVKSDVCVGLPRGVAEELFKKDESWMFSGDYGLIQTTIAGTCPCDRVC